MKVGDRVKLIEDGSEGEIAQIYTNHVTIILKKFHDYEFSTFYPEELEVIEPEEREP